MNRRTLITRVFFILLLAGILLPAAADIMSSPTWGYSLDLPEGFILVSREGNDRYLFQHESLPVSVIVASYPETRFGTTYDTLNTTLSSLNADYDLAQVEWRNTDCTIANYDFYLDGVLNTGWGVAASVPETESHTVLLCFCPESRASELNQFVISTADSLYVDRGSWYEAGPITAFAYPDEDPVDVRVQIDGKPITFSMYRSDFEADAFVVEREYAVLLQYNNSERWAEAWQRYYRQIYRNASGRLKGAAFVIQNALGPRTPVDELAQTLLTWTQGFDYERNTSSTDFTPVTAALSGSGCDCDSRALLLAVLLSHMNAKTSIFVSAVYSHAVFGIVSDMNGAKLEMNGEWYVLGETTAPVKLGLIASTQTVSENWIGVPLSAE